MAMSRYIKVKEKTENKWLIPLFVFLFATLGVAFSAGGFTYGRYVTVIILGLGVLLDIDDTFCLLCFCLPFASLLKFSLSSTTIIAILYIVVIFKLMSKERMDVPPIAFFAFLILASLQTFTIFLYNSIITNVFSTLLNVVFVLFTSTYFSSQEFKNSRLLISASLCLSISCTLMLLLCDIFPQLPRLAHAERYAELVAANRYAATVLDPNELSQLILIAICLLIAIMPSIKTAFSKIVIVIMAIYMAFTGVRTNSKSYVVSIFFLFAFLLFIYLRSVVQKEGAGAVITKLIPIILVAVAGAVLLIQFVVVPVFEARSSEQTDLLTNRTNIWGNYIEALFQSPDVLLIGCGANNVTGVLRLVGNTSTVVPHNFYLEYIIQFGFGGLVMLFLCWKKVFTTLRSKLNTYFALPLLVFMITAFGISVNANDCLFILLALLSIPLPEELSQQVIATRKREPSPTRRPL